MPVYLVSKEYADENTLIHYRTRGSKNGIRRYQNEDGTLTPEGRIHYGIGEGRMKRDDVNAESQKETDKRQKKLEKTGRKVEKTSRKVEKYQRKSEKYEDYADAAEKKANKYLSKAEKHGMKVALKNKAGLDYADKVSKETTAYKKFVGTHQESLFYSARSQKFTKKAERGSRKLAKLRERMMNLTPEDIKEELEHSGLTEDFFEMYDALSEKQKAAICVLLDDILPDEDDEVSHSDDNFSVK